MRLSRTAWALLLTLLLATGAWAEQTEDPFEAAKAGFMAAETAEDRLVIVKNFLSDHPDHERAGDVVEQGALLLTGPLENYPAAIELAQAHLKATTNKEVRKFIQEVLLGLYGKPEYGQELVALVGQMYVLDKMIFTEHLKVLEAATSAEQWSLVDVHVKAGESRATAKAFRAAYPDRDFSDEYIMNAGKNRQAMLATFGGWSLANQGDLGGALKQFQAADEKIRKTFLGVPDNELYRFWGQTLVLKGQKDDGLRLLSLAGIYGADDLAMEQAHDLATDLGQSKARFEEYLWGLRQDAGVVLPDFQAENYAGKLQSFHELKGRKATMLAFWFPT